MKNNALNGNNRNNVQEKTMEKVTGGSVMSDGGIVCVYCGVRQGQHSSAKCVNSPVKVHVWQFKPDVKPVEN